MKSVKSNHIKNLEKHIYNYYDGIADNYDQLINKHFYCYNRIKKLLRHLIPINCNVLEIGCGVGQNLISLNPKYGIGIDFSEKIINRAREIYPEKEYPNITFKKMNAINCSQLNKKFDYIILPLIMTELIDILTFMNELKKLCNPDTRIIFLSFNNRWEPILKIGSKVGFCQKHPVQNWMSKSDYQMFFELSGFQKIKDGFELLCPVKIPFFSDAFNRIGSILPFLRSFSMIYFGVLRSKEESAIAKNKVSVSVVVPCKNEEENIDELVKRIPTMGSKTEVIFVDDKSSDLTSNKIKKHILKNDSSNIIKLVSGPGKGKGAACRAGFAKAENDIFIILDADMTVMPESLQSFIDALLEKRGEFINGSRLVYPIEGEAMRFLNILGNKMFAILFSFLLSQPIKDTLCGTKAIWRKDYGKILEGRKYFGSVDIWGDYDWIFGANRHNLKIIEMPVHYRKRVAGETKMNHRFTNAWIMLKMCRIAFWKTKVL